MNKSILKLFGEMEKYGKTHNKVWNIPRDEAQFLNILIKTIKPKKILELGTSIGYSSIWMGLAAKQYSGKITTIEFLDEKIKMATENIKKARLHDTIRIIQGDVNQIVKKFKQKFDFIFMDTAASQYFGHFKAFKHLLKKGSIIATDNAIDFKDSMKDYLSYIRNSKEFQSVLIPIGNGVELTYKLR